MPDPNVALSFRPDYEVATHYISAYGAQVSDEALSLGYRTVDLAGADATQDKFLTALTEEDPLYCLMFGHGSPNIFVGNLDEVILEACVNDQIMRDRINSFVSCSVGLNLGPSMVDKTALMFIGYHADFFFIIDESYVDPLDDPYARAFMEAAITPAMVLLRGASAREAYDATIKVYNWWITYWWASRDPVAAQIMTYLIHDRDNLIAVTSTEYIAVPKRRSTLPLLLMSVGLLYLTTR